MSVKEIQEQLRQTTETALQEMDWLAKRSDGGARWYLECVAERCGVDIAMDPGDMANAIGEYIDYLASQCQENRVEPAECDLADRVAALEKAVSSLNSRLSDYYSKQVHAALDRIGKLERRLAMDQ